MGCGCSKKKSKGDGLSEKPRKRTDVLFISLEDGLLERMSTHLCQESFPRSAFRRPGKESCVQWTWKTRAHDRSCSIQCSCVSNTIAGRKAGDYFLRQKVPVIVYVVNPADSLRFPMVYDFITRLEGSAPLRCSDADEAEKKGERSHDVMWDVYFPSAGNWRHGSGRVLVVVPAVSACGGFLGPIGWQNPLELGRWEWKRRDGFVRIVRWDYEADGVKVQEEILKALGKCNDGDS
eukprot:TRINITY_DN45722_c0_g1_i2.p1 TRINITY_DN45722_c0_g1~~TRINITY_DN45722_c0_g1_i2.p1  ORF type:complete len:235 (+),score=52.18 TRINITY_DN45722_c0_g1_i2:94-798(+)